MSRVSGNAQSNAGKITGQIGILQDQVQTAKDAVESLYAGGSIPDADALLAAQNTLTKTLQTMPSTMSGIASATQATVSGLSRDLSALSGHIGAMGETLNNASENLGGTIMDISDLDTPELLTGKVENCTNDAEVHGDLNIGGIVGAMAMENDMDLFEDIQQYGENSLNFDSEIRAVVLACDNSGMVSGNKQNVGGLVGWQSLGLLKDSTNTGNVEASKADHVGGVCGISTGFVRGVASNCAVSGDSYVGGIAGSGAIVTDSLAQVKLIGVREKGGNILGWREEALTDVEDPIRDNYYLSVGADCGAVDGISYAGMAEPMELRDFMGLRNLPETFKSVKIQFVFEDGSNTQIRVPVGETLDASQIPELPEKEGYSAIWDGLAETDLSDLLFDLRFDAVYESYRTTIACDDVWKDGRPMLLLEGIFTDSAEVSLDMIDDAPVLNKKEVLLKTWRIQSTEQGSKARVMLTDSVDSEQLKLYFRGAEGQWNEATFQKEGSYLVFPVTNLKTDIAIVQMQSNITVWILGAVVLAIGLITVVIVAVKKRHKRSPDIPQSL